MKLLNLIIVLLVSSNSFSQPEVINDTLSINGEKYYFKLVSFGKYSKSKPMMAFTCCKTDIEKIEKSIIDCYSNNKLEYTDFYIIGIESSANNKIKDNIVEAFLRKIDYSRMQKELSTIRLKFKQSYDVESKSLKIEYDSTSVQEINKIPNLRQNVKPKEICNIMGQRQ